MGIKMDENNANTAFRRLVYAGIAATTIVTIAYFAICFLGFTGMISRGKMLVRCALIGLFAIEGVLFAWRTMMYHRLGGDFELAHRSALTIMAMIIGSAIFEAFYAMNSSPMTFLLPIVGSYYKVASMFFYAALLLIPLAPVIANLQGNDRFGVLIFTTTIGALASAGAVLYQAKIGMNAVMLNAAILTPFGMMLRMAETVSPLYLIQLVNCVIMFVSGLIHRKKRIEYFARIAEDEAEYFEQSEDNEENQGMI